MLKVEILKELSGPLLMLMMVKNLVKRELHTIPNIVIFLAIFLRAAYITYQTLSQYHHFLCTHMTGNYNHLLFTHS